MDVLEAAQQEKSYFLFHYSIFLIWYVLGRTKTFMIYI